MSESDETIKSLKKLLDSVSNERKSASMFNSDPNRDEATRESDALLQTLKDLNNDDLKSRKRYYKRLEDNIKAAGIDTIDSIDSATDAIRANDQSAALAVLGKDLLAAQSLKFKSREEADEHFKKLSEAAAKSGIDIEKLGVQVLETARWQKGRIVETTFAYKNLNDVTDEVIERQEKYATAIQASINAHEQEEEMRFQTGKSLKKFGSIIKMIGKDFLRLGEEEARLAQQTSTADAGLIKGITSLGIAQTDYMHLLQDTRTSSMAMSSAGMDFNASLEASADSLKTLTKDNTEAAKVAGKFHENMRNIGVSQKNLGDAVAQQTEIYEKHYAAVGFTADQFADLTAELVNSQGMRSTLLALQEKDRKAYVLGIQTRMMEYKAMGYSIEAAKALNSTFEAMNKMNPKNRMKQAAKQRAMMGAMGMGDEGARAFDLQIRMRTMNATDKLAAQEELTKINAKFANKFGEMSGSGSSLGQSMIMQTMADKMGMTDLIEKFETSSRQGSIYEKQAAEDAHKVPGYLSDILSMMSTFKAAANSAVGSIGTNIAVIAGGVVMAILSGKLIGLITGAIFKGGIVKKIIGFIASPAAAIATPVAKMAVTGAKAAAGLVSKGAKSAAVGAGAAADLAGKGAKATSKATAKIVSKAGVKSMIKKIPFIGLLASVAFAVNRLMDGDVVGAGLEILSGGLGTFVGAGTAASLAVDAGLLARDLNTQSETIQQTSPTSSSPTDTESTNPQSEISVTTLFVELNETMKNLNSFLQANGEMTSEQTETMKNAVTGMKDQQRMDALRGRALG